ncbi:hypothetical protein C8R43DRAFT_1090904 [Mycena crocata]|nr:hypothetical protein C8R43DRAFT_1090904 [Mycena crocata]
MAPIQNGRVIFDSIPESYPIPGETTVYDTSGTIDLETVPLNGGFLVKTLVLSVDPYLRGRMRSPEKKSIYGFGISVVLRSETAGVEVGNHIYGHTTNFQEYAVISDLGVLQVIEKHPDLPWTAYVGAAGMPGKTAYMGWKAYSDAKAGEVAFVTAGAGPVGSYVMVIQLAKQAGMKVIASAGSEEKVKFMQSIGAHVAFNYKTTSTREVLEKEGPVDVYWDNVGGESLEAAIDFAAINARFLECGMISGYNTGPKPLANFNLVVGKCLHIHGILTIPPKIASGELKYAEEITKGLDKAGDVILAVQKGTNKAKAVILVADE